MQVRRLTVIRDIRYEEAGLAAPTPVTRVAVCAVIRNPYSGKSVDDLNELIAAGGELGSILVKEAAAELPGPAISYGKAAIVGADGDIEHAAALLHPRLGRPMRAEIGGGKALIPSTQKIGAVGESVDVPLGHKDDVWSFDHFETINVRVDGAPRHDEIVVIVALSDGGRPRPRVRKPTEQM